LTDADYRQQAIDALARVIDQRAYALFGDSEEVGMARRFAEFMVRLAYDSVETPGVTDKPAMFADKYTDPIRDAGLKADPSFGVWLDGSVRRKPALDKNGQPIIYSPQDRGSSPLSNLFSGDAVAGFLTPEDARGVFDTLRRLDAPDAVFEGPNVEVTQKVVHALLDRLAEKGGTSWKRVMEIVRDEQMWEMQQS
jgi:hypothetical protein